jgi:hypothetical protein
MQDKEETVTLKKSDYDEIVRILDHLIELNAKQQADSKAFLSRMRGDNVVEGAIIAEQKQIEGGK